MPVISYHVRSDNDTPDTSPSREDLRRYINQYSPQPVSKGHHPAPDPGDPTGATLVPLTPQGTGSQGVTEGKPRRPSPSLLTAIAGCVWQYYLVASVLRVMYEVLIFTTPPILRSVTMSTPPILRSVTMSTPPILRSVTISTPPILRSVILSTPPIPRSVIMSTPPILRSVILSASG